MEKKRVPAERYEKMRGAIRKETILEVQCYGNQEDGEFQRFGDNSVKSLCWVK